MASGTALYIHNDTNNDIQNRRAMVHILQLTDTHLFADPQGSLYDINTRNALTQVIAHVKKTVKHIDVVLLTGDLVHDESVDGYLVLKSIVSDLGSPAYYLPGNHDNPAVMQQTLDNCAAHNLVSYESDNWSVVLLDSTVQGRVEGQLSEPLLDELEQFLSTKREKHILVALHHHMIDVHSPWLDALNLRNSDQLKSLLEKFTNVKLVVNGHVHQEIDAQRNGIRYLGTPATCFQFAVKSKNGGADDRPPAYRHIVLHDDGSLETTVHYID